MKIIRLNLFFLLCKEMRFRSKYKSVLRSNSRNFSYTFGLMKTKSSSSHEWIQRQLKDPFVKRSIDENYRCRSSYKLLQIDDKYNILQPGFTVIDCGAAPGSWTQVAVERVNSNGIDVSKAQGVVIGIDMHHFQPIEGAFILPSCDFTKQESQEKIRNVMDGKKANVILSDMAPHATGIKSHNHDVIINLCFSVLRFSIGILQENGTLLCKLWMGAQQNRLENAIKSVFDSYHIVKPEASRMDSAEIFLLAQGFSGLKTR